MHTIFGPHNREDPSIPIREKWSFFGFKMPLSSFHRNERRCVSKALSRFKEVILYNYYITLIFTKHISFLIWCIAAASLFTLAYVTTPHKGSPKLKVPPNAAHKCGLLFPLFGGCMATILHGLTYPKILCAPEKEERKRDNGDIAWRGSSLSHKT